LLSARAHKRGKRCRAWPIGANIGTAVAPPLAVVAQAFSTTLGSIVMNKQFNCGHLLALMLLSTAACAVHAEAGAEKALTRTAADSTLEWTGCPEFMPAGCSIAVLHGDPAKNNADIFFKVPGKSKLPLHWHSSAERIILVGGELQLTYDGQEDVTLKQGTYAYGPAKLAHSGTCVSDDPCILFIAFETPVDAVPVEGAGK
jgi:quercetin dioxygenase-like cupin family protein